MNMRPGLIPPEGTMWRGATMDPNGIFDGGWARGTDPQQHEDYYGKPLHIYRNFNTNSNADFTEHEFVADGGIIFYSIQP